MHLQYRAKNDTNSMPYIISRVKYLHGIPWNSMEFHGSPWNSMEFHGIPWNSMEIPWSVHGVPWSSMEFHGVSMEFHGVPWSVHGVPWTIHRVPWNSMELHELFMEFHGIPLTYLFTFNCITKFARVPHQQRKKGINIFQYYFQSTIMEYYIISANFVFSGKGVTNLSVHSRNK